MTKAVKIVQSSHPLLRDSSQTPVGSGCWAFSSIRARASEQGSAKCWSPAVVFERAGFFPQMTLPLPPAAGRPHVLRPPSPRRATREAAAGATDPWYPFR